MLVVVACSRHVSVASVSLCLSVALSSVKSLSTTTTTAAAAAAVSERPAAVPEYL